MVARDYEGVSTLNSGEVIELLVLTKEYRKLIETSLAYGIDDDWRKQATPVQLLFLRYFPIIF